jgi:WD40 repeat protein
MHRVLVRVLEGRVGDWLCMGLLASLVFQFGPANEPSEISCIYYGCRFFLVFLCSFSLGLVMSWKVCIDVWTVVGHVVTGSWDKTVRCWDPRGGSRVGTYQQAERVYSMSLVGHRLVVATAGRHITVYDLRHMQHPEQMRESSLKYQTRCVRCYPNGTGMLFYSFQKFPRPVAFVVVFSLVSLDAWLPCRME